MSLFTDEITVKAQELEYKAALGLSDFPRYKKILLIIFLAGIVPGYLGVRFGAQAYFTRQYEGMVLAARPSFTDSQPVKAEQIGVFATGENTYSGYAFVSNPNLELSIKNGKYTFTFYSASGSVAGTSEGRFFLLPNEKKYLVASRVESSQKLVRATIAFSELKWQKKLSIPQVKVSATKPVLFDQFEPQALSAQGSVINNSPYLLNQTRIVFLLYDSSRKLIAVSQRDEFTLKPGERRTYNQLWPYLQTSKVDSIEVMAESNALDPDNLLTQQSGILPNGASDLSRPTKQ